MQVTIWLAGLHANSEEAFRSQAYSYSLLQPAIECVLRAMYKSLQAGSAAVAADKQLYSAPLSGLPER